MYVLRHHRTAMLIADGFSAERMLFIREALVIAGGEVDLIAPHLAVASDRRQIGGIPELFQAGRLLQEADPAEYHSLVLLGGVASATALRELPATAPFIATFLGRPRCLGILGNGFLALQDLRILAGRQVAAPTALRLDLLHAGAQWVDQDVAVDERLVTGASKEHLGFFVSSLLEACAPCVSSLTFE